MKKRLYLRLAIVLGFILLLSGIFPYRDIFAAEKDFPKKEITIIVNFGPGGARDILARGVGKTMSKYLGVPMVVMNQPGGGGAQGLTDLYHADPDGYTIGVGALTDIIDQIMEKRDYDNKKFSYVGRAQSSPGFWFVKADSPLRSLKDMKASGKPIRYSAFSLTSNTTVAAMVASRREGFPLVLIGGYQSAAAAALALIRGEVEFSGITLSTATPFVKAGQLRPLLAIAKTRYSAYPEISTIGEAGYPDLDNFSMDFWFMASPGVPKARMDILEDALMKTLKDPEFLGWAKGANVDPGPLGAEETKKMALNLFDLLEGYKGDIEKYIKK
jgi:tripartite-type tricarboxylate transporter receptor subunit TctC